MQIFNLKINGQDVQWFQDLTFDGQIEFIYNRSKYSKEQISKELTDIKVISKVIEQPKELINDISSRVPKKTKKSNKS